jgi:hypothetical protein
VAEPAVPVAQVEQEGLVGEEGVVIEEPVEEEVVSEGPVEDGADALEELEEEVPVVPVEEEGDVPVGPVEGEGCPLRQPGVEVLALQDLVEGLVGLGPPAVVEAAAVEAVAAGAAGVGAVEAVLRRPGC